MLCTSVLYSDVISLMLAWLDARLVAEFSVTSRKQFVHSVCAEFMQIQAKFKLKKNTKTYNPNINGKVS